MDTFSESEIVLRHAQELEKVDKIAEALQLLHDFITSKSDKIPWHNTLETIMFKYVELCVDLLSGKLPKDGLIHYGYICLKDNVSSFEEVVKYFLHLSTERAKTAWNQVLCLDDALDDDLEVDGIPDDLPINYFKGSDADVGTVWVKFLWETYWTVLDILGTNSRLEMLYSRTVNQALQLCKTYKQTMEFCRLCDFLRNHVADLHNFRYDSDDPYPAPEILRLCLDTRFKQLEVAYELALWKEAVCAAEDIYTLMCMMENTPIASLMVLYYAKLTKIFWVAKSHLYHAYAWLKIFLLQKTDNKNWTQKDLQLTSSSIVLAALSVAPDVVPFYYMRDKSPKEPEDQKECNLKIVNLAGVHLDHKCREGLSRSALLSELVTEGVISCAAQEIQHLYNLLENEHEYRSLDLASKVQPLLTKISQLGGNFSSVPIADVQLEQYVPALEKLTTFRLEVQKELKRTEEARKLLRAQMDHDKLEYERKEKERELVCMKLQTLKTREERRAYIRSVDVFKSGN